MGGGQSTASRAPPVLREDSYPSDRGIDGIAWSNALACQRCQLTIAKGISTSSVKLYRETGNVTSEECSRFSTDIRRVQQREMAFREFKKNLQAGKYLRQI